jgi:hypothetical protein
MAYVLETLDQLLCGDLPLGVVRGLYPDHRTFAVSVHALLRDGNVRLHRDGVEVAQWRWRELFEAGVVVEEMPYLRLELTEKGARFIAGESA